MILTKKYTTVILMIATFLLLVSISSTTVVAQENDDSRTIDIEITEEGNANWIIEVKKPLNTNDNKNTYSEWIDEVNNNSTYENEQRDRFESIVNVSSDKTNRNMRINDMNVSAYIDESESITYGITEISFTWEGFSRIDKDNNIIVGDVFHNGYSLTESEVLTLRWNENNLTLSDSQYNVQPYQSDNNSISWRGNTTFSDNELRLELISSKYDGPEDTTNNTTNNSDEYIVPETEDNVPGFGLIMTVVAIISSLFLLIRKEK